MTGVPDLRGMFDGLSRYVEQQIRVENERLEREALAFLVACVPVDELRIVELPPPAGSLVGVRRVMTVGQLEAMADNPPEGRI